MNDPTNTGDLPAKPDSALCLQVAREMASQDGQSVTGWECPDDPANTRGAPPGTQFIDLLASLTDNTTIALEHTTIESYERQLHEGRQLRALLVPLATELAGRLPADRSYHLNVGIGAVADNTLDPDAVQTSVTAWVLRTAPQLPAGSPHVAPDHYRVAGPPDVEIAVSLYAWPADNAPYGGNLAIGRFTDDADAMMQHRIARLARALDDKLPKLLAHVDSRTVLVLEDVDLVMSNIVEVTQALRAACEGRVLCDTIVVVEADGENQPAHSAVIVYDSGRWHDDLTRHRFVLAPTSE